MRNLDIVCPVFREEEMIALFHRQLSAALEPLNQRYRIRIIYVLDPAPDRTEALLCSITAADPRVEVLVMSRRFGHQAALIAGIDCSRGDAVVMLDSDMQHPPELIPQLVDQWEHGADIVQMIRQDGSETRLLKRLTSRWFYHLLQKVGAVDLPAGASDYRLLSQRVAAVVRGQITERNPFLRGLVSWVGFNIVHLPFKPSPRQGGRSHYRSSTLINFALNGLCSFSKLPLRFCVGLGMAIAFLSFLAGFHRDHLLYAGSDRGAGLVLVDCGGVLLQRRATVFSRRHRRIYRAHFRRSERPAQIHRRPPLHQRQA